MNNLIVNIIKLLCKDFCNPQFNNLMLSGIQVDKAKAREGHFFGYFLECIKCHEQRPRYIWRMIECSLYTHTSIKRHVEKYDYGKSSMVTSRHIILLGVGRVKSNMYMYVT